MEEYNPERSPYFSHYQYKSKIHETLGLGERKPVFHQQLPMERVQEWMDKRGSAPVMAFADSNPDLEVEVVEDGVKKTITLPFWARDNAKSEPYTYYKKSPWVFRCVDIKGKSLAGVEWAIYPSNPDKEDVEAYPDDNPAVKLLNEVNPEDNWHDLISRVSKDLDLFGKAFILKAGKGTPLLLKRLNPATIKVIADNTGISHFEQSLGTQSNRFERETVMYFRDYDPEDDTGSVSAMESCKSAAEVEIQANSHLADFFENNAMPAVVMSTPDGLQYAELQRLQGAWSREFGSKGKRGKTAFLSHGFKPEQLSYPLNQLALTEIRDEARKSICAAFGVPPTLAGAWEAANFATADTGRSSLYTETIIPRCRYIQGVINAELMKDFGPAYYFRFEPEKLDVMQEDTGDRATWLGLLVEKRIIKPEVAAVEMGFTEDDVPEPMPNPFLMPQNGAESNFEQNKRPNEEEEDTSKALIALRKFRRKAVNRCKDGRSPVCDFNTEYIPDGTIKAIQSRLEGLELVDDVHAVFDEFE